MSAIFRYKPRVHRRKRDVYYLTPTVNPIVSLPFPPTPGVGEDIGGNIPVEILYPINMQRSVNKMLYRTDNKNWVNVQKSTSRWGHEFITLGYRVINPLYMKTLVPFMKTNVGQTITLNTPGVQPFSSTPSESNRCYLLKWSKPSRDNHKIWKFNILFLKDPNA